MYYNIWMVVSGLLSLLLWRDQASWGFRYIVDIVDDDGMYLTIIVLNIPFNYTLSYLLYHSQINLNYPIIDGFERSYELIGIVGNASGGMISHFNKEIIQVHLEFPWTSTCPFFFFITRSYICIYYLEYSKNFPNYSYF